MHIHLQHELFELKADPLFIVTTKTTIRIKFATVGKKSKIGGMHNQRW